VSRAPLAAAFAERVTAPRAAWAGGTVWLVVALYFAPHPYDANWARALLLLAPAACLPLLLPGFLRQAGSARSVLRRRGAWPARWWFIALVTFAVAQSLEVGVVATLAALPWALLLMVFGVDAAVGLLRPREFFASPTALCVGAAPLLGIVGAAWTLFDRLGVRPLELPAAIVLLTAIHFHFAGVVLPLVTAAALDGRRSALAWITALLAVGGVPLVAGGITATQLGAPPLVESIAASAMAVGGLLVAAALFYAAGHARGVRRVSAWVAAGSLSAGMLLAVLYALRHWLPLDWLDIPWMRGVHGTLNAVGFGLGGSIFAAGERSRPT
jgi:YndJ-like protein